MTTGTLMRVDTGDFAVVRVIDPGVHESAPYSRAVGILDRWVAAERRTTDQIATWLQDQTTQALTEIRQLADEQLDRHRQVRVEIAVRVQREGTVNLPPAFEEISPVWAELPETQVPGPVYGGISRDSLAPDTAMPLPPSESIQPDPVQAYFDADNSDEMPGRAVVPGDGIPVLAAAYRGERFVPDPADYPQQGRYRGPRSPLWRRVDRALQWLERRFTPTKGEQ